MKPAEVKPWSQVDDDLTESALDAAPVSTEVAASDRARLKNWKLPGHWAPSSEVMAAVCACVGAGWALLMASVSPLSIGAAWLHGLAIIGCNAGACVYMVRGRYARRRGLEALRHQMTKGHSASGERFGTGGMGGEAELGPFLKAIEQHAENVEQRVRELLEDRKDLALKLSLADVCRRQAESILNAISDPIVVVDAFDQLAFSNPAAEELFGFSGEHSRRKPIGELIGDAALVRIIQQAREADRRVARRRIDHEIGEQVFTLTLAPVLASAGGGADGPQKHGVVALLRDTTKERETSKMKSEFVAHVSHELRTPLSSIRAYVEMLVDGEAADEATQREYYEIIQSSADRLGRLIDNMLNISRIEAGTVRINKAPVAISMIVKEALDVMRPQATEKQIALTEELSPVVDQVLADHDLINEAIMNLLSNAVKYTPTGGSVHVRMSPNDEGRRIRIDVMDSGVGIPKEALPKMFQKFFRVEENSKMAKGTGLGLNLVKQIVETVHGGELILASEPGKGSTFSVILPLLPR